ncbi:MAG: hypothetical protein QOK17_1479 [Sphingomonadales bacterium]|jgi:hypothetical protein|nr:hypothetical protein [Sphingomonadales bacterium]
MFAGWEDFYLLIGSAAAALVGLLFVVSTLTAGRPRSLVLRGNRLYLSPIVGHFGAIVLLSGAAMAPTVTPATFAVATGLIALIGLLAGLRIARAIRRASPGEMFDACWYGLVPAVLYVLLGAAAFGLAAARLWAPSAVAALLMALLLVCIHNAWDLVTWLAPGRDEAPSGKSAD